MRTRIVASLLLATALAACSGPEDQAAKARIFSPEDPPKVLQAAAEKLDSSDLADEAEVLDRVLAISAREAAARLGPHVQKGQVTFAWSHGGQEVKLAEDRFVALGANGDFHVRLDNDQRQGMEWVKVAGVSYARSRYAKFRERRRDRGSSEHVVDSAYATLSTFRDLVHGAMKLSEAGTTTISGRKAVKYTVALGEARAQKADETLPPVVYPKGGPDRDTSLRLEALEKGKPTAVSGTLFVDAETAVPLKADLKAAVLVPGQGGDSKLDLAVKLDVEGVGGPGKIEVPEHIEDAARPPGVVATLEAYGIPRVDAEAEKKDAKANGEAPAPDDGE